MNVGYGKRKGKSNNIYLCEKEEITEYFNHQRFYEI